MTADTQNSYRNSGGAIPHPSPWHAEVRPRRACAPRNSGPAFSMPPVAPMSTEPTPIWLAALIASHCLAIVSACGQRKHVPTATGKCGVPTLSGTSRLIQRKQGNEKVMLIVHVGARGINLRDFLNDRLTKADLAKAGDLLTAGLTEKSLPVNLLKQLLADCGFKMTDSLLKRMCEDGRLTRKGDLLRSSKPQSHDL